MARQGRNRGWCAAGRGRQSGRNRQGGPGRWASLFDGGQATILMPVGGVRRAGGGRTPGQPRCPRSLFRPGGRDTPAVKEVPKPPPDHFRPPVSLQATWDALHGMWPAEIVRQLRQRLPQGYIAAPTVHPGSRVKVDVATYERDDAPRLQRSDDGGAPTAEWVAPEPTVAVETEVP